VAVLVFFILGTFIGSFLGVLATRFPQDENPLVGRSYCDKCGHLLSALDLIPVASFVFLGGKCRYCGKKLSYFYPIIELATGVLYAVVAYQAFILGQLSSPEVLFQILMISVLIVVFFSDIKFGLIPDKILLPGLIVTFVWMLSDKQAFLNHLASGVGAFVFFLFIFTLTKGKGMGFGDVKLSLLIGFLLGFPLTIFSVYIAFLTGAVVSIILILAGKKKLKGSKIPFGPFLAGAAILSIFIGTWINDFFLTALNLR